MRPWSPGCAGTISASPRWCPICTGAFILGHAGLLDGRRATTHWLHLDTLRDRFPLARVVDAGIFAQDGPVWTSAGVTAGIDLALALVERDHGHGVAMQVAKRMVLFLRRSGHQAQFSQALRRQEQEPPRLRDIASFVLEHLPEPLPVERIAAGVGMSQRSLSRWCREHLDGSPAELVRKLRLDEAPAPAGGHRPAAQGSHRAHRPGRLQHLLAGVHPGPGGDPWRVPPTLRQGVTQEPDDVIPWSRLLICIGPSRVRGPFFWQCMGSRTDGIPPVDQSDIRGLGTGMTTDSSGSCLALALRVIPSLDAYIGASRVLPPLPVLLPMHCVFDEAPRSTCPGGGKRMADGPDEAHQLPGDRRADLDLEFAPGFQLPVSGTEPHLGFPGDLLDLLRGALSPALEGSGLPGRVVIGPGRLHQDPSDVAIAGFCDAAAGPGGSAGMLTRDEAQVGHQLGGGPEPVKVADLRHGGGRCDAADPAQGHQPFDQRSESGGCSGDFQLSFQGPPPAG